MALKPMVQQHMTQEILPQVLVCKMIYRDLNGTICVMKITQNMTESQLDRGKEYANSN
jgi:hypothetical protein